MSYVDRRLAPGERVAFRTRLHPVIFTGAATFVLFVAGVVALLIRHNDLPGSTVLRIVLGGMATGLASLVSPLVRWRTSEFVVTDRRVLARVRPGLLSVRAHEMPLSKVEIAVDPQNLWGRLLGYGTVRLGGVGGAAGVFPQVGLANMFREAVLRQAPRSPARAS